MPALYGIIGCPLGHSFSPPFFNEKFRKEGIDARYEKWELKELSSLPQLIASQPDLRGLNVTIPHKQKVLPYLDRLSEEAAAIGAVNCIRIRHGKLEGYNTDVLGFGRSLLPLLQPQHKKALVLGTGGSSLAITYALRELGIEYRLVSRTPRKGQIGYEQADGELLQAYPLIVNTTPLGMFPDTESCPPIAYDGLGSGHLLFDLVYNPEETEFLRLGRARGAVTKNGAEMLELQALASWEIWNQPTV